MHKVLYITGFCHNNGKLKYWNSSFTKPFMYILEELVQYNFSKIWPAMLPNLFKNSLKYYVTYLSAASFCFITYFCFLECKKGSTRSLAHRSQAASIWRQEVGLPPDPNLHHKHVGRRSAARTSATLWSPIRPQDHSFTRWNPGW